MSTKKVKCDHGISPIEYTIEDYIADDGREMLRVVILRGKAYVLYMKNPDTLDGRYDIYIRATYGRASRGCLST